MNIWNSVFDNHMHLREDGYFLEAASHFKKAGGTSFNLVNLPDYSFGADAYYSKIYGKTLRIAEAVRSQIGIDVVVTLGPYPLDLLNFTGKVKDAEDFVKKGMDLAVEIIGQGSANALGEIGRPHFQVEDSLLRASERILEHGMASAGDNGIPVILHTEDLDEQSYRHLCTLAENNHIPKGMLVKHHALASDFKIDRCLTKSTLATRSNVREAITSGMGFLLETDYVDDPTKPGKVIPADSVPKRALMIKNEYDNWEDIFQSIFVDIPSEVFRREFQ